MKYKHLLFTMSLFMLFTTVKAQSSLTIAEDFMVKSTVGQTYSLFPILDEGKIVVLTFFTTTWGSCNIYTPEIVLSNQDFGCNQGDVFYLGVNWGADNNAVNDFIEVHAVGFPCASGLQGLGNETNEQYGIASHITALVIMPNREIIGQFYGPNAFPTRDSLNNLLLSLGAQMQNCSVGISEESSEIENPEILSIHPNPISDYTEIQILAEHDDHCDIQILNTFGGVIDSFSTPLKKGQNYIDLGLHSLKSGIY